MNSEMNPIETKEIRGISLKALGAIIISTASIVGTVLGTYYALTNKIESIQMQNISEGKLVDLKMQQLDLQMKFQQTQIDQIRGELSAGKQNPRGN
jgi:hypothetical protein